MSMIPFSFMPRSRFDLDPWFRSSALPPLGFSHSSALTTGTPFSTLDLFDPFEDFDREFGRNLFWLDKPDFFNRPALSSSMFPRKYRVNVDVSGFNPQAIKTSLNGNRVTVSARDEERFGSGDNYSVRELKKTYDLPADAELDKVASFVTSNGQLVIDVPLKSAGSSFPGVGGAGGEFFPKISEDGKSMSLEFNMPDKVDPAKINVTCKDRELIIKAEDKSEKTDASSSYSFYQRSTLPENTDFNAIKCTLNNNKLSVTAPLHADTRTSLRQIPIENGRNH
jgi:HSP20 family molecular chaperone IbpA